MVSKIVSTFALAFEKYTFSKQIKKEFFERFYINRQVVQEAVLDYTLLYIGRMKDLSKKKRTVKQLTSQVFETSINY